MNEEWNTTLVSCAAECIEYYVTEAGEGRRDTGNNLSSLLPLLYHSPCHTWAWTWRGSPAAVCWSSWSGDWWWLPHQSLQQHKFNTSHVAQWQHGTDDVECSCSNIFESYETGHVHNSLTQRQHSPFMQCGCLVMSTKCMYIIDNWPWN